MGHAIVSGLTALIGWVIVIAIVVGASGEGSEIGQLAGDFVGGAINIAKAVARGAIDAARTGF